MGTKTMKFKTQEFNKMLDAVKPVAEIANASVRCNLMYFNSDDVVVSSGQVTVVYPFPIECDPFMLRFSDLNSVVKSIRQPEFPFEMTKQTVKIKTPEIKADLTMCDDDPSRFNDIIDKMAEITKDRWQKLPDSFKEALKAAYFSVAKNDRLGVLTGIHINHYCTVGSDNHRVTCYNMNERTRINRVVLAKNIECIWHLPLISYSILDNLLVFSTKDNIWAAVATLEDIEFPDYSEVLDVERANLSFNIEFSKEVINEIDLVKMFASGGTAPIEVSVSKDGLTCSYDSDFGRILKYIKVDLKARKETQFKVNPLYFLQAVNVFNKAKVHLFENKIVFTTDNASHAIALFSE